VTRAVAPHPFFASVLQLWCPCPSSPGPLCLQTSSFLARFSSVLLAADRHPFWMITPSRKCGPLLARLDPLKPLPASSSPAFLFRLSNSDFCSCWELVHVSVGVACAPEIPYRPPRLSSSRLLRERAVRRTPPRGGSFLEVRPCGHFSGIFAFSIRHSALRCFFFFRSVPPPHDFLTIPFPLVSPGR